MCEDDGVFLGANLLGLPGGRDMFRTRSLGGHPEHRGPAGWRVAGVYLRDCRPGGDPNP